MGDFNARLSNNFVDSFCRSYSFKSLIKKPTCFKRPDNPTCIELILTNSQQLRNFSKQQFGTELVKELSENNVDSSQFELFQTFSFGLLNKLTSSKQKTLMNNQPSFMFKEVLKAIIPRSKLLRQNLSHVNRFTTNKKNLCCNSSKSKEKLL